ncbi:MAG TPA: serine hydrolase [Thermoanaerobaculia bacterium]|nr:serine hydrolase [Thermoanaerobaculia bacterium]
MLKDSSRPWAVFAFLLLLTRPLLPAYAAQPSQKELAAYADKLFAAAFPAEEPGAAVLVIDDGQVVLRKGYGLASMELGVPVSPDMVFEIGSVTKQFTAAAILMLQEQGKLRVEDEVTKYLPDFPTHGQKITIEHLLTHTSGIPSYTGMQEWRSRVREDMPVETLVGVFKGKPLDFNPGEEWRYNNSAYVLLGAVIEKASGKSYEQFVEEEIFQKAGMKSSRYGHQEELVPLRASGYSKDGEGFRPATYLSLTQPYAAGSLLSTVDDLAAWDRAMSGDALISKASRERMETPVKINSGVSTGYGYGVGVSEYAGRRIVQHSGGIFGFSSQFLRVPEKRLVVAILSNTDGPSTSLTDLSLKIAAKALGQALEDRKGIALDPKTLDEYVGVYRFDAETTRAITREGSKLYSQRSGGPKIEIVPTARDDFFFTEGSSRMSFRRDGQGKVTGAVFTPQAGMVAEGRKTDEPLPQERQAVKVDPAIYDDYVGTYELPGIAIVVVREGERIFATPVGQPKTEIFPESETKFFLKVVDAQVEFVRGADGKVTGLVLEQGGRRMEGKRK